MILAGFLTLAFFGYCIGMSVLAGAEKRFLQLPAFHLASVVLYFALAAGILASYVRLGHPFLTIPSGVLVLISGVVLGWRYAASLIDEYIDRAHAGMMGIGTMKVPKTYDRALKAEHEGDPDRALEIYREEAEADPADPEPLRRMSELHARRGESGKALDHLRQALERAVEPEDRAALSLRLSDLLEREGRIDEAARALESVVTSCPGTPLERGARERLTRLGRPLR